MAYNFKTFNRDQMYILPPSMREWLPKDHLVWFIIDIVSQLDLTPFYKAYNAQGMGNAAYDPAVMAALYFYSYCVGERSSRKIEKNCLESVPFRIISGDLHPDHSTISRFRKKFQKELADLFKQVLVFCGEAGLCDLRTVSVDGTKIKANASLAANRDEKGLEREIRKYLEEAEALDAQEDALYGSDKRGDELPPELATREGRLKKLREFKEKLAKEKEEKMAFQQEKLEKRKQEEEASGRKKRGRKPKTVEKVAQETEEKAKINLTDPESRIMKSAQEGHIQGYNGQIAVSQDQVILTAELTQEHNDKKQMLPMLEKTLEDIEPLLSPEDPDIGPFLFDAGYPSEENLASLIPEHPEVIAAVKKEWKTRKGDNILPLPLTLTAAMACKVRSPRGKALYAKRGSTVEPVFGQLKEILGFRRFSRRGFLACACEWKMMCTAHNLLKLWRYGIEKVQQKVEDIAMQMVNLTESRLKAA